MRAGRLSSASPASRQKKKRAAAAAEEAAAAAAAACAKRNRWKNKARQQSQERVNSSLELLVEEDVKPAPLRSVPVQQL